MSRSTTTFSVLKRCFLVVLVIAGILLSVSFRLQQSLYNNNILTNTVIGFTEYQSRHLHKMIHTRRYGEAFLQWKDDNTLLNIENFRFITNNSSLCKISLAKSEKLVPILIHSARYHFDERNAIRSTYGSIKEYKSWRTTLIFLLGEPSVDDTDGNLELKMKLSKEISTFGDIIVGSFVDIYANLPYKHLMGYKYILNYCSWADYVLKVDDDMFIDIFHIIDVHLKRFEGAKQKDWILCNVFTNTTPIRDPISKYYASLGNFTEDIYPDYCSGWFYGITVDWIQKIYSVSHRVNCCIIDDVMVTGQLRQFAEKVYNETAILDDEFWEEVTTDKRLYEDLCAKRIPNSERKFGTVVYVERGDFFQRDMTCLWNKTLEMLK